MFESVRPVAPCTAIVTDADLDRIEQAFDCRLPHDYRAFLKRFGPGALDEETFVLAPNEVISQSREVRDIFSEPEGDPRGRLFWYFDNAAELLTPDSIQHLICIGWSGDGDYFVLLPGTPPRFLELPRHSELIRDGGTTMDSLLTCLDPRIRYTPRARRIVENGVVHETDGGPDGRPWVHPFTPEGYEPPQPARTLVEQEIVWGHSDDGLVTWSLPRIDRGQRPTAIQFHMEHYPLLALLEAIAFRDPSTRFEATESDEPTAELDVPRFEATLRAGAGMKGLTLYVTVPEEHASALYRWLAAETAALGHDVPHDLHALVAE